MYPDKQCPMPDCEKQDSLSHTLVCDVLREKLQEVDFSDLSLSDAFSKDIDVQKRITTVYGILLDMREKILETEDSQDDDI